MAQTSPASGTPKVYFDQNVFSHIARTAGSWRSNPYVAALDGAEAWISPTHVVELMLCPDADLRRRLAEIMLGLCGGRRMMRDYGTLLTHGFLFYLEQACEGSIRTRSYVEYYDTTLRQLFLGQLAMMASGYDPNPDVLTKLTRAKVEGRWLRAEAGKDPGAWLQAVKDCAEKLQLTPNPRPELKTKPLATLVEEIHAFEADARRIDKKDRSLVERNRAAFVQAYAVGDVYEALGHTFGQLVGDLILTVDFSTLFAQWATLVATSGCRPLPSDAAPETHSLQMLDELVRSLWRAAAGISASSLAQEILFRDYVDRLNETEKDRDERIAEEDLHLPTDSLTFDADHAALALTNTNVFVTRDQVLLNSCKTVSSSWAARLKWKCEPVFSHEQLSRQISASKR